MGNPALQQHMRTEQKATTQNNWMRTNYHTQGVSFEAMDG